MDGSAYAVAARIGTVRPRVAGHASAHGSGDPPAPRPAGDIEWLNDPRSGMTADSPGLDELLGERWSAFRARWSQLTFYLFDADGWR
jgi:hypothetical protein